MKTLRCLCLGRVNAGFCFALLLWLMATTPAAAQSSITTVGLTVPPRTRTYYEQFFPVTEQSVAPPWPLPFGSAFPPSANGQLYFDQIAVGQAYVNNPPYGGVVPVRPGLFGYYYRFHYVTFNSTGNNYVDVHYYQSPTYFSIAVDHQGRSSVDPRFSDIAEYQRRASPMGVKPKIRPPGYYRHLAGANGVRG